MYDFGCEFAQTYKEQCENCGKIIEISTQSDNSPEYQTEIYVKCQCRHSVPFLLPVN